MNRDAYKRFIEQAADLMDEDGLPHMAGRVVGALMVCRPSYMSHDELAEDLQASRGAISMATQLMLRMNIIERISLPGERKHYYQLRTSFLEDVLSVRAEHLLDHQRLFDAGVELLRGEPMEAKARLIRLQAFLDFLAEELAGLNERWQERREELIRRRIEEMTEEKE